MTKLSKLDETDEIVKYRQTCQKMTKLSKLIGIAKKIDETDEIHFTFHFGWDYFGRDQEVWQGQEVWPGQEIWLGQELRRGWEVWLTQKVWWGQENSKTE